MSGNLRISRTTDRDHFMGIGTPVPENSRLFVSLSLRDGELLDLSNDTYPTRACGWGDQGRSLSLDSGATHYCFVLSASAKLTTQTPEGRYRILLRPMMYRAFPCPRQNEGACGISRLGFLEIFMLGGRHTESEGRSGSYADSLIIPSVTKGDPCLNHLSFPKSSSRTPHVHPSIWIGIVVRGLGRASCPTSTVRSVISQSRLSQASCSGFQPTASTVSSPMILKCT